MSTTIQARALAQTRRETVPGYIPSSPENLFTEDCYLEEVHLSNTSGSSVTVTIADKQDTPLAVVPTVTIAANSDHIREFTGRLCPGGLTWVASTGSVVVGYVRARVR